MKTIYTLTRVSAAFLLSSVLFAATPLRAEETVGEKVQNAAGDVKTSVKKSHRAAKRHTRKALGNDSVLKDAKDKVQDTGDDLSNDAKKLKRKVD